MMTFSGGLRAVRMLFQIAEQILNRRVRLILGRGLRNFCTSGAIGRERLGQNMDEGSIPREEGGGASPPLECPAEMDIGAL